MDTRLDNTINTLEEVKRFTDRDIEYWKATDLQRILAYSSWQKFDQVIGKAIMACESTGIEPTNHFNQTVNLVEAGSGTMVKRKDYYLTRYACYLIAMNGASHKPEVATAQTYFAVQTRRQELQDQLQGDERRIKLRYRVKDANKRLASTAKKVGVRKFSIFQDAGYKGLYDMSLANIKSFKNLSTKDDLLDRAGRTELAANEFRITQTGDKLIRDNINTENGAIDAHYEVGQAVRTTINKLGGTMPENLTPEPSIKKLVSNRNKSLAKSSNKETK